MFKLEYPHQIQLKDAYSALIYGAPGVGKTTLALSSKNPVLLDFDSGIDRVNQNFWTATLRISSYQEVLEFLDSEEINQFDTIVIDTVGAMVDLIMSYLIANNPKLDAGGGKPKISAYSDLKAIVKNLITKLKMKNKKLIFVAHEKIDENDEQKMFLPNLGSGKGSQEILNMVDLIGRMYREEVVKNKGQSMITFSPYNNSSFGKNCMNLPSPIKVPNPIEAGRNMWIQDVIDKAYAKKIEAVQQARIDYEELLKETDSKINDVVDAESCNKVFNFFKSESKFEKIMIWKDKLLQKSKELGLIFSKEMGEFTNAVSNS